ncbi:MAG: zinc-ribbon domain-containing protein [Polyangia bacterium]
MPLTCKMCGTQNKDGEQFCSACGSPLAGDQGQPVHRREPEKKKAPAKTMLGVPAAGAQQQTPPAAKPAQPAQPAQAAQQPKKAPAKTMLGIPAAGAQQQAPPAAKPAQPARAAQPAPQQKKAPAKTMLGVPAAAAQQQQSKPSPVAKPAPVAKPTGQQPSQQAPTGGGSARDKRTVLGMPAVTGEDAKQSGGGSARPAEQPAAAQVSAEAAPSPKSSGGSAPASPDPNETPTLDDMQAPSEEDFSRREAKRRSATEPLEPAPSRAPQPSGTDDWDEDEPAPARKGSGVMVAVIAGGIVVAAGLAALIYLLLFADSGGGRPQVFPSADGENLTVVLPIPGAPNDAAVHVRGKQVPIVSGQARFDLPMSELSLGENTVQVTYVEPGGAKEKLSFPVVLRQTVATDLSGLTLAEPYFEVAFQVAPGNELAVDGQKVKLVNGSFEMRVPLSSLEGAESSEGDSLIEKIPFQLTGPDGTTEQGQHVVTIPLAKLQIDRPTDGAVVEMEEITCAGATEEGARVTVNGEPTAVTATRFSTSVPLDEFGEHVIEIEARASEKAPRKRRIKVTRVESLAGAVEEWAKDANRKLDYPTIARDPDLHTGEKVVLSGRVVNMSTEKGVTAMLLYIGEGCPAGARCAVYITFRGETRAGLQSQVDVYGTVKGKRDVELRGGEKETMPAVDAAYVLLSEDDEKKKRRRR